MATTTREYELVLMLDPEMPDERREQIASQARERIESGGTLKHDTAWGMRKLAYEIRQRTEADYRLFRFETAGDLLGELNHNLRIADGVLRFRIFKVEPGSPAIVPPAPQAGSAGGAGRGARRGQAPAGQRPAEREESQAGEEAQEPTAESASAEEAPPPAEEAPAAEAAEEQPSEPESSE